MTTGPQRASRAMWWSMYCDAYASLLVTKARTPSPRSCTRMASIGIATSPAFVASTRQSHAVLSGSKRSVTRWRMPLVTPSQATRSTPTPSRTLAREPTASMLDGLAPPRRSRIRPMPPSTDEARTWLTRIGLLSLRCSMANTAPFGRTEMPRPALLAMRRRPRSRSRGVHQRRTSERGIGLSMDQMAAAYRKWCIALPSSSGVISVTPRSVTTKRLRSCAGSMPAVNPSGNVQYLSTTHFLSVT